MKILSVLAAAVLLALASRAAAGGLSVSPPKIEVASPARGSSILVGNSGDRAMTLQVRVFRWTLVDGEEHFAEASDVIASPPMVTIGAQRSIQIRILRIEAAPATGAESYQVVVDQLPAPEPATQGSGISFLFRFIVPAFFYAPDVEAGHVTWAVKTGAGGRRLVATNVGDKPVRLADIRLGSGLVAKGTAGWLLGHGFRSWPLPARGSGDRLTAVIDQATIHVTLAP